MKISLTRLLLALAVLAGAGLACNLPARGVNSEPAVPTVAPADLQQYEDQLRATLASVPDSGPVTITITQQQLNAFIASEMAGMSEPPLSNPQVFLVNGQMEVYGTVNQGGINASAKSVLQPRIDADGRPRLDVTSITVGPFALPDSVKDQVGALVNNTLDDYLRANENRFRVTDIQISDGRMTVTGTRAP